MLRACGRGDCHRIKTQIRTMTVGEANRGGVRASSKRSTGWPKHERSGAGGRMTG